MDDESLDLLCAETDLERDTQLRHFQSLDARAGFLLGFTGVLVALGGGGPEVTDRLVQILGTGAALTALVGFFPRNFPLLDLAWVREAADDLDRADLKIYLLDLRVEMISEASDLLERRSRRILLAAALLGGAVATLGIGAVVTWVT